MILSSAAYSVKGRARSRRNDVQARAISVAPPRPLPAPFRLGPYPTQRRDTRSINEARCLQCPSNAIEFSPHLHQRPSPTPAFALLRIFEIASASGHNNHAERSSSPTFLLATRNTILPHLPNTPLRTRQPRHIPPWTTRRSQPSAPSLEPRHSRRSSTCSSVMATWRQQSSYSSTTQTSLLLLQRRRHSLLPQETLR
jgi:hypothetical protein